MNDFIAGENGQDLGAVENMEKDLVEKKIYSLGVKMSSAT